MCVIAGASWIEHVFKMVLGILSGPLALLTFKFLKSFSTPSTVISKLLIDG